MKTHGSNGALLGLTLAGLLSAAPAPATAASQVIAYIGTFTGPKSQGIHAYRFEPTSGSTTALGCVAEARHPAFLAIHPGGRLIYAVNEVGDFHGSKAGAVSAFSVDRATGRLTLLNQVSSVGAGPCHLSVDRTGRCVLVANYGGGSVAVLPIRDGGRLGEATAFVPHTGSSVNPQRQREPHAHSINLSPDNRYAFAADLGIDQVRIYRFAPEAGTLEPHDPPGAALPAGSGPRHLAFHPDGRRVYVINELLSTVAVFGYRGDRGVLEAGQTVSTLPAGWQGRSTTAEVVVHPSGRWLYASNRGHDSLAVFKVSAADGSLDLVQHVATGGKTPRNFALDPTGGYLWAANQDSDSIVLFRVNTEDGRLTATGQTLSVGSPVCVRFLTIDEAP